MTTTNPTPTRHPTGVTVTHTQCTPDTCPAAAAITTLITCQNHLTTTETATTTARENRDQAIWNAHLHGHTAPTIHRALTNTLSNAPSLSRIRQIITLHTAIHHQHNAT
jgi:hypothetical protein